MSYLLQESLSTFNCMDYEYFKPTDTIILRFHNAEIKSKWEERWCGSLRTPVGLRDFKSYVLEEEDKWFLEQEELYQKQIDERIKEKRAELEIKVSKHCSFSIIASFECSQVAYYKESTFPS